MVTRGLLTKLVRDVWRAKGQFVAASAVVMCGLAVYVTLYSCYRNLRLSRDSYYRQYHFADFFIELQNAPQSAVRIVEEIPGVLRASGRIVKDVPLQVEGNEESVVGRLVSMPEQKRESVNDIHIVTGSYFTGADEREVVVEQRFCEANNLRPGDCFFATINERKERLHIVGTAYGPEYVYPIRSAQQWLPNDRGFGVMFVPRRFTESAFNMGSAVNSITGLLRPGADVQAVLDAAKERLEPYGVYYRYDREGQLSHRYLSEEIRQLRNSAVVVPAVFLLIAAMIVHVIMGRITQQQRTQIGLLCALGYSKRQIVAHYVGYALLVALLGGALGIAIGQVLAGQMLRLYQAFFRFPSFRSRFYPDLCGTALLLSTVACVAGAVRSAARVARLQPAQAMRPSAPPSGRRILLERIEPLWNALSLEWRATLRNIARARSRTVVTVFGVMTATVILVLGLVATDFFDYMIDFQFNKVDRSDLHVDFAGERAPGALADIRRLDGVRQAEGVLQCGFELRNGWREKTVLVMGLSPHSQLHEVYDASGRRLAIPTDGLLIPDRLARVLDITQGSVVTAAPYVRGKKETTVSVRAVAEQYFGLTAYADRAHLSRLLGEADMINGALVTMDEGKLENVIDKLNDVPGVSGSMSSRRIMEAFIESARAVIAVTTLIIALFAGSIALAVIYNASTINISERERELATLRAEGLSAEQAARVGTDDILLLGALGIALGLPLGGLACKGLARLYETDLYKMPAVVFPRTYVLAVAFVIVFLLVSRYICKKRVAAIDIVRALKTRE